MGSSSSKGDQYGNYGKQIDIPRPRPSLVNGKDPAHIPGFIPKEHCASYMERVAAEVPWEKQTRWTSDYVLPQKAYYYDETKRAYPSSQIKVLEELTKYIEDEYKCNVFSIWLNLFPDGGSHIEWHQDQYGYDCFTMSFGCPRKFVMRKLKNKEVVADFYLNDGDLYFFSQDADKQNEHCVPEMKDLKSPRISILFFVDYPLSKNDGLIYDKYKGDYKK